MPYFKLLASTLASLLSASAFSFSHVPLVDNQPAYQDSCPFSSNMAPTTASHANGSIDGREYHCVNNGTNIVWTLTIPEGCQNGGCGLILDMHGAGMNANTQNYGTKLRRYGSEAMKYGASTPYIVAQPSMTDLFNDAQGNPDPDSVLPLQGSRAYINELPHINTSMVELISTFDIDSNRIHWHGFSRGSRTVSHTMCEGFELDFPIASYAISGGRIACDLLPNTPIIMTNGKTDVLGSNKMQYQDEAEAFLLSQYGMTETTLYQDENWEQQQGPFLFKVGQHIHKRFQNEDYVFESIRHSAQSIPAAGHCHPVSDYERWLVCRANFDIGEKIIQFFINNSASN